MFVTHIRHKCSVWAECWIVCLPSRWYTVLPVCFYGLNKYWDFDNSEHLSWPYSQIRPRSGEEISFLCSRNWTVMPSNCNSCALIYDPNRGSNSTFHLPQQKAIHKHSSRCQSNERSSASSIEFLSGKQPLARLSFVTRLVRVTSIMASLALTAQA
jgi:hypothetical protein